MISVLIRAGTSQNVFECISSIKETSPSSSIFATVVSSKRTSKKLNKLGIRNIVVSRKNASLTTNKGLSLIKSGKVLITDSDTVFAKGCIRKLEKDLDKYDVVKAKLIFRYGDQSLSKLIANLRLYFNSKSTKMFTPGLAFNLSIKNRIGGYFFDENVTWGEDSEFSNRIDYLKLKAHYDEEAMIYHPAVSIKHDLASAFLTGAKKPEKKTFFGIIVKRIATYGQIYGSFGFPTFLYGLVWYLFFDLGKISKLTGNVGKTLQDIAWKY